MGVGNVSSVVEAAEWPELGHMLRVPSRGLSIHLKTVDKLGSCIPRAAAPLVVRSNAAHRNSRRSRRHLLPIFLLNKSNASLWPQPLSPFVR
jgi:hypothetical protein